MMKTNFVVLAGILALAGALQADPTYTLDFTTQSNSPGLVYDGSFAISPYSGTLNGASVTLYCDDFNDNVNFGQSNITVYSTALTATNPTLSNDTRYGAADAPYNPNGTFTAGTQLYDEMAWLATQMMTKTTSAANDIALQEAIWDLTNDSQVNDGASPTSSKNNAGTAANGLTGNTQATAQSAATWIADAGLYYSASNSLYASLVTSNWNILTATGSAGCTIGSETNGCSGTGGTGAGSTGTGTVTQEFLNYTGGPVNNPGGSGGGTPEPASFILIGSGLLAGGLLGRRRRNGKSNQ